MGAVWRVHVRACACVRALCFYCVCTHAHARTNVYISGVSSHPRTPVGTVRLPSPGLMMLEIADLIFPANQVHATHSPLDLADQRLAPLVSTLRGGLYSIAATEACCG